MRSPAPHDNLRASYPIEIPLSYELDGGQRLSGQGRTLAISSQSVRADCGRRLPARAGIQLSLAWPAVLPDGTHLSLWIRGEVVRSALHESTVRVIRYEFKTRRPVRTALTPVRGSLRHLGFGQVAAAGG